MIQALQQTDPKTGHSYFKLARKRGPRIAKFARYPRSLNKWRQEFNEPSHFRNPAASPKTKERHIRDFVERIRAILDYSGHYLITAAVNEIRSGGVIRAALNEDAANTPGVEYDTTIEPKHFILENGQLSLKIPTLPIRVVPNDKEIPHKWTKCILVVQHSHSMSFGGRFLNVEGSTVDVTDMENVLSGLACNEGEKKKLKRRLKSLGYTLEFAEK